MQIASTDTWQTYRQTFYAQTGTTNAGSVSNPYIIDTPGKLAQLAYYVNSGTTYSGKYFKQTVDLNLGGHEWVPIGNESHSFQGNYDGQRFKINGVFVNQPTKDYVGLFGRCVDGTLLNIEIGHMYVCGQDYVGGLSGDTPINITNCDVRGVISGRSLVGGLTGFGSDLTGCYFSGSIFCSGTDCGGISGSVGRLTLCSSSANIYSEQGAVGGLAGSVLVGIEKCIFEGDISSKSYKRVGGLVGGANMSTWASNVVINDCQVYGQVNIVNAQQSGDAGVFVGCGDKQSGWTCSINNCSAVMNSNISLKNYSGTTAGSITANINGCFVQVNLSKFYSSGDFSNWSLVENINGGLPVNKNLNAVAVGSATSSQITNYLKNLGYTLSSV